MPLHGSSSIGTVWSAANSSSVIEKSWKLRFRKTTTIEIKRSGVAFQLLHVHHIISPRSRPLCTTDVTQRSKIHLLAGFRLQTKIWARMEQRGINSHRK